MTSRERVLAAFEHREADRVPLDLSGHRSSGIAAIAYPKLRECLGLPPRPVRVAVAKPPKPFRVQTKIVTASALQVNDEYVGVDEVVRLSRKRLQELPKNISENTFRMQAAQ